MIKEYILLIKFEEIFKILDPLSKEERFFILNQQMTQFFCPLCCDDISDCECDE